MYGMHNLQNLSDLVLSGLMLMGAIMIGIMAIIGFIKMISIATSSKKSNVREYRGEPEREYERGNRLESSSRKRLEKYNYID